MKKSGKGTKVTPETFAAWQEAKQKKREEAAKKLVETELRKKKGGKGLSVLSGRELYTYKKAVFKVADETDESKDEETNEEKHSKHSQFLRVLHFLLLIRPLRI